MKAESKTYEDFISTSGYRRTYMERTTVTAYTATFKLTDRRSETDRVYKYTSKYVGDFVLKSSFFGKFTKVYAQRLDVLRKENQGLPME